LERAGRSRPIYWASGGKNGVRCSTTKEKLSHDGETTRKCQLREVKPHLLKVIQKVITGKSW